MFERINIVKMVILPEESAIPVKIPKAFFPQKQKKIIPKFVWNHERSQIAKAILRKNKAKGITHSDFEIHCKATVIIAIWCHHENRHRDQCNRAQK